jgi:hypothetical protein
MSETQSVLETLSDDENGTLVLVDINDSPMGSISMTERLTVEAEHLIHRTCSLHIFWHKNQMDKENCTTPCILLSSLDPGALGRDNGSTNSKVSQN